MMSARQPLGERPRRVAKRKTREFTLNMEYLEDRYAPVSDIIPGTDLAGAGFTGNVPPGQDGAVGVNYLVSVVNNNLQYRLKNGAGNPVEFSIPALFANNQNPTDNNGNPILDSNGNPLVQFDPTPIGIDFVNNTNIAAAFQINAVNVGDNNGAYDPSGTSGINPVGARVEYDQYLGRFIIVAYGHNNDNLSFIWTAISVSENPGDGWNLLSMISSSSYDPDGRGVGVGFLDSTVRNTQFGLTRDSIVIAGNVHLEQSAAPFDSRIFIVDKQYIYEGLGTTAIRMGATLADWYDGTTGSHHTDLMPTHNYDADENTAFLLEAAPRELFVAPNQPGNAIVRSTTQAYVFRIDNAPFFNQYLGFPNPPYNNFNRFAPVLVNGLSPGHDFPTVAAARGNETGPVTIDVSDGFIFTSAVYRPDQNDPFGGSGSIWTTHTLNRDTNGDLIPDSPTVRWYEFTVNTPTGDPTNTIPPMIRQQGGVDADVADAVFDPSNQFALHTYAPAISVNSLNDMAIGFSGSNARTFISAFYTGRFEFDFALGQFIGTTRPAKVLRYGEDFYNRQAPFNLPPWGPYSGIGVDPTNDDRFWVYNAYAAENTGLFGVWQTTWGAFELVPDTLVFVVDVSLSMEYIHSIDVNGDGVVDSSDDRNGDGLDGSVLDQAIFEIESLFLQGLLPSQGGLTGNVGLIIFGRDAKPVEIDLTGSGGSTLTGSAEADNNGNGIPDFLDAVRSIDVGEAGVISQSTVDPTRTFYNSALAALGDISALTGAGVTQAQMYSNGSGRLPDPQAPNIPPNVRIDTIVLGPYQLVGDITPFTNIAAATLSRVVRINNDRGVSDTVAPIGLSAIPRLRQDGTLIPDPLAALIEEASGEETAEPPVVEDPEEPLSPAADVVFESNQLVDSEDDPSTSDRDRVTGGGEEEVDVAAIDDVFGDLLV